MSSDDNLLTLNDPVRGKEFHKKKFLRLLFLSIQLSVAPTKHSVVSKRVTSTVFNSFFEQNIMKQSLYQYDFILSISKSFPLCKYTY